MLPLGANCTTIFNVHKKGKLVLLSPFLLRTMLIIALKIGEMSITLQRKLAKWQVESALGEHVTTLRVVQTLLLAAISQSLRPSSSDLVAQIQLSISKMWKGAWKGTRIQGQKQVS